MTIYPSQDSVIWRTWIDLDLTYLVAQSKIIDVPRRYSPEYRSINIEHKNLHEIQTLPVIAFALLSRPYHLHRIQHTSVESRWRYVIRKFVFNMLYHQPSSQWKTDKLVT